ncbi:TraR/DksA family transcriptional regulator [Actinomadura graeca]|uniref:TraR/DksA family transcriptional regulator n=1 Tax=Actinomadura graeca TaxID=2750812 RepID=A0ABX8R2Y6_9ACTN|nr:TraR/DksA family transcriptional regulator [Actinomadura graeca]
MLPALPVEAISAREADMAAAGRGTPPPGKKARGTRPSQAKKAAAKAPSTRPGGGEGTARPAKPVSKPGAKSAAKRGAGQAAKAAKAAKLPVREGEGHWTASELAEVRAGLEEQIGALRREIAASASQIAEGDTSEGAGDDQADAGAKTYEREHELALSYNSQDLLAQIERAVQRMDAGTYGICESCAKPIGKARLQVFPRATLCVSCKQREERR